jgi:hypothetical protein
MFKVPCKNIKQTFFGIFFSFLFLFFSHAVFASIYTPGQTLNPDCTMGSTNCGVNLFSSFVPYTGATTMLDLNSQMLADVGSLSIIGTSSTDTNCFSG